jgi:hypothetical protein
MAIVVPAGMITRTPELSTLGGLAHVSEDVQAIVEGGNFLLGRWTRTHLAQTWAAGECGSTAGPMNGPLLAFTVRQGLESTQGLWIQTQWDSLPDVGAVAFVYRFTCLDDASDSGWIPVDDGPQISEINWASINRPDQLSTILLEVADDGGMASSSLLSLHIRDMEISAGMP